MSPNESDSNHKRYRLNRRRLLQLTGVGVGSLTMATAGSGIARAESDCVNRPFEREYEAKTINVSKIASGEKKWEESDESIEKRPSDETLRKKKVGNEELPPAAGAQQVPDSNGLLDVGTEYEGIIDIDIQVPTLPSDAQIAVGRSKAVQVINSELAIFNQRSGTLELAVPFENFFEPIITEETFVGGLPKVGDPRVRYDPNADRFVISTLFRHIPTFTGALFLAVSDDSDPNGTWHLYRISPAPDITGVTDYPPLGLDQDAIYLTEFFIPQSLEAPDFDVTLAILDKQAAYRGDDLPANQFTGLLRGPGLQFTVQPAFQPFSGGQSGTYYLMSSQVQQQFFFDKNTRLTLWKVSDPLGDPSVTCSVLTVDPFEFIPLFASGARQPNTDVRLETVSDRLMNLDYNDRSLWTAHTIRFNWDDGTDEVVTAIRWYEIDPTTPEVLQSGTYGEPGTSYFIPRIESSEERTLMTYNVSGPDTYPSIGAAGRTTDSPAGEMEDAVLIKEGQSPLEHPTKFDRRDPAQWGDYMGISVHPTTDRFWMSGQYSPNFDVPSDGDKPDRYATWIAEITFDDEN